MIIAVVGGVIWWVMGKVGTPIADYLDNRSQVSQCMSCDDHCECTSDNNSLTVQLFIL